MINIENLYFHYDERQVLHDISVQLPQGSITGLIGPNGAGKSTLMRCMAGLENPSSGKVLLDGQPVLENPRESYAKLGYLPDNFGLPQNLTVLECLTYAASSRGVSVKNLPEILSETVQLLGLEDKLGSFISELSRGQKQRVGIGQVIIHKPKFLLLDEPASGLDPEARHELSLLLLKLQKEGMTILVSSHILSELDEYCSHMLVIKQGRIQAFQALQDENTDRQTVRLCFATEEISVAAGVLQGLDYVYDVKVDDSAVLVLIDSGDEARVRLIRDVVLRDLALSGADIVKTTLLQSYQNSLQVKKQGEAA